MSRWLPYLAGAIALAVVGFFIFGHPAGILTGLLALWPALRQKLAEAKSEGAHEQAKAQVEKANQTRSEVSRELEAIKVETETKAAAIRAEGERRTTAPTEADEAELLKRFDVDPPPKKEDPK